MFSIFHGSSHFGGSSGCVAAVMLVLLYAGGVLGLLWLLLRAVGVA
jgi:hypothetical protein